LKLGYALAILGVVGIVLSVAMAFASLFGVL